MTFTGTESSSASGRPIELYEIVLGGTVLNFTSAEDEVTVQSTDYTPVSISRSAINVSPEARTEIIVISLPSSLDLVRQYVELVPGAQGSVTIKRVHRDDGQVVVFFKGIIRSVGFSDDGVNAQIAVLPLSRGLSKSVPRFLYSSLCNHVLYDVRCKVAIGGFTHSGIVTQINGAVYTINGLTGSPADASPGGTVGGFMKIGTTDWRMILSQNGDEVTLLLPFNVGDVDVGTTVDIFAGCDHTISTCLTKFNAVPNYGGYAFVPLKNPFATGL